MSNFDDFMIEEQVKSNQELYKLRRDKAELLAALECALDELKEALLAYKAGNPMRNIDFTQAAKDKAEAAIVKAREVA